MLAVMMASVAFAIQGASHRGYVVGEEVVWESHYVGGERVELLSPLPDGAAVTGAHPIYDDGDRVVALGLVSNHVTVRVPADEARLRPPLAAEQVPQRVILEDLRFVPASSVGAEHHVRHWSQPGIDRKQRLTLDFSVDGRAEPARSQALYLIADDRVTQGIAGSIRPRNAVGPVVMVVLVGLFVGLLAFLGLLYRSLDVLGRKEKNRVYIDKNFGSSPLHRSSPVDVSPP
jgi:hypothetical protein